MTSEKAVIFAVMVVTLALIASITWSVNQPKDLVCFDFARSTEDTYALLSCYYGTSDTLHQSRRFNATLFVESQVVDEEER